MEACLHFRGVVLNASEAGISRATECWRSTPHCGSEGVHSSPVGIRGALTSWSLMTSGGENFDKRCRDFLRRKNRGISEILGERRLKSPDRYSLMHFWGGLSAIRGAYGPCRILCARLCLVQCIRFPVFTQECTTSRASECPTTSPRTYTQERTPYNISAKLGNKMSIKTLYSIKTYSINT